MKVRVEKIRRFTGLLRAIDPRRREEVAALMGVALRRYHEMEKACEEIEMQIFDLESLDELLAHPVITCLPDTVYIVRLLAEESQNDRDAGELLDKLYELIAPDPAVLDD